MGNQVYALLLAGGKSPSEILEATGVKLKALVEILGKPMFTYTLDALLDAEEVNQTLIFCGETCEAFPSLDGEVATTFSSTGDLADALKGCLDFYESEVGGSFWDSLLLISSSDIPLVTAAIVSDFILEARNLNADGVWPIVEKKHIEARFPGSKRTYLKTKQGTFTGGNMFLVKPKALRAKLPLINELFKHRKNPLAMASIFGFGLVFKVITGGISIPKMEEEMSNRLGVVMRALQSQMAEIAVDVDKVADLRMAEEFLLKLGKV